jgi:membrane protein DedA with SNARE-associated domain/rhodanese-related sulfurtransferase
VTLLRNYDNLPNARGNDSDQESAMTHVLSFLVQYGYTLLFLWVLVEQLGLPLPSAPLLLATGALAAAGKLNLPAAIAIAFLAALAGDLFWYRLGRRHGTKFLGRLCRLAAEPDSCVRRAENFFERHGPRSLLVAKFIPGLNTVAAPIAGAIRTPRWRFLWFDSLGILLWVATFEILGFVFTHQLQKVAAYASHASALVLGAGLASGAAVYVARKGARRRYFLAQLRMARITVEELKRRLDAHEEVAIIDLRHPLDFLSEPYTIPGAIRIPAEQLEKRQSEIPGNRDVVLYCTCPNEASSANAVLKLRQYGITRVRPLEGGFRAWREREFPLESEFGPVLPLKRRGESLRAAAS